MGIYFRRAFPQDVWSSATNRRSICRDNNGRIFLSYTNYAGAFRRVTLAWSLDDGETWTIEEIPTQGAFSNSDICIAVDSSNNIIAVWGAGTEVVYRKRLENGSWNAVIVVGSVLGKACEHPSVAIDSSDTAHIVWKLNLTAGTDDIRYNTVSAAGVLGVQLNVTNLVVRRQVEPHISVCRNNIAHIVWQGGGWGLNPNFYNIQYNTVTAGVLGVQVGITDKAVRCDDPECAADSNGFVHVIYYEAWGLGTHGLYYTNNIGGAFVPLTRLTTNSGNTGLSITLDAADNRYVFSVSPTLPKGTLIILSNKGAGWITTIINMVDQYNDIYTMWSWYPRIGGSSPNILTDNWLAYVMWPMPEDYAYLMSLVVLPTVATDQATNLTPISATINGTLTNDGKEACDCGFEWGETIPYGNTTPTESKTTGQSFSLPISGLRPNTTYHFRAFATNQAGTSYGNDRTFTTNSVIEVETLPATNITENSARIWGRVRKVPITAMARFDWGGNIEYGAQTPWAPGLVSDDMFYHDLRNLAEGRAYHFRAVAMGSALVYGNDMTFTTRSPVGPVVLIQEELAHLMEVS